MAVSSDSLAASRLALAGRQHSRADRFFFWLALAGFPASLTSPGATISMALVAAYGLWLMVRRGGVSADVRRVGWLMIGCYAIVLVTDLLNGGGISNIESTGVNYLPLIALAPYTHALRSLNLTTAHFDRAMQVTILAAVAYALVNSLILGEARPGGINLNPIPYAFVIAIWAVFLFSRALEYNSGVNWTMAVAILSVVPIAISGSKISIFCFFAGVLFVGAYWTLERRAWVVSLIGLATLAAVAAITYLLDGFRRWELLAEEVTYLIETGALRNASLGERIEVTAAGWKAFMDKPLLGHGFLEKMEASYVYARVGGPDITALPHFHNDYITHLVAYGIPGAIFLLVCAAFVFRVAWSTVDSGHRRATFALLVMLLSYMSVEIAFNMDPVSGAVTIVLGMVLCTRPERAVSEHDTTSAALRKGYE